MTFQMRIIAKIMSAAVVVLLVAGPLLDATQAFAAGPSSTQDFHGAGSTFAAPLYDAWIAAYTKDHPNTSFRYEPVGSGEGLARFSSGVVDFADSDVALPAAAAQRIDRGVVQLPITAGMVVLAYNLPGLGGRLRLPQDVYVDIFFGKIRNWNDPRLLAANPGLHLPATTIAVVARQDSSGTTYAFTSHLEAVNPLWGDTGPGTGKIIAWPHVAMLARGNEGVASRIKISDGSIGYVEYGFARRLGLEVALLQNKAGQFVAPSPETGAAAIEESKGLGVEALARALGNPPGAEAYPIVTYSWLLLHRDYPDERGRGLAGFARFAVDKGQNVASDMGYIPLPQSVVRDGQALLARIDRGAVASAPGAPPAEASAQPQAAPAPPAAVAPAPPRQIEEYTARAGDTLRGVAAKLYHDARKWRDIAAANPKINARRRLRGGEVLKLPQPIDATSDAP